MTTVSADELARLFEVTPHYLRQLAQTRIIPAQSEPGKYDLDGSTAATSGISHGKEAAALTDEGACLACGKACTAEAKRDALRAELAGRSNDAAALDRPILSRG